ncbi:hypothetical protein BBO99_00003336 [Phytophthora kernoviae]|uniref:Uncharacterized protein n=1 Tax=Phytophthora kernoviae TaxID=325452 RepID=A0A421GVA5_9STRA|nr:hypothetical protein BBI17_003394 [Phytophthora kernoviae]RLN81878.1 hypothetical protein BBO99_00003336 [Phytophthora kernoviae]
MATKTRNWRAEYTKAAATEEDEAVTTDSGKQQVQTNSVLAFLDLLLAEEGGECILNQRNKRKSGGQDTKTTAVQDKTQVKNATKRLASVAEELVVALPELNASVSDKQTPRTVKVRVLQLQLLCRLLRYGGLKQSKKQERKKVKKEIRSLLDRVALLLDAANPPSLADEDADERSPFQELLQRQLMPRLQKLMPELMRYLLRIYELVEDEEVGDDQNAKDVSTTLLPPLQL